MKKTLLLFCLLAAFASAKAQQLVSSKPIILVDSVTMPHNIMSFIKDEYIKEINVEKSKDYDDGIIKVTLKDHQVLTELLKGKMLTLNDLKNTHVLPADQKKPLLYVMNFNLITDTAGIRIPSAHYYKVDVVKGENTPYFKKVLPNAMIMVINTVRLR